MAKPGELERALQRAHAAGDVNAARRLARAVRAERAAATTRSTPESITRARQGVDAVAGRRADPMPPTPRADTSLVDLGINAPVAGTEKFYADEAAARESYAAQGGRAGELFREGGAELMRGVGGVSGEGENLQETLGGLIKLGAGGIRAGYDYFADPNLTTDDKIAGTIRTTGEMSGIAPLVRTFRRSGAAEAPDQRETMDRLFGSTQDTDAGSDLVGAGLGAMFSGARGQAGAGKFAGRAPGMGVTPLKDAGLDALSNLTGGASDLGIMAGKPFVQAGRQAVGAGMQGADWVGSIMAAQRSGAPAPPTPKGPPQAFTAPAAPPSRSAGAVVANNLDRVLGGYIGAEVGGGGMPAFAAPGDGNDGPNQLPGAATGAVVGALAPRAALNATRRVGNAFGNSERVASGAVRRILKSGGIRNADEARAAMTARFGDKPAAIADLSQEGIGTAAGIARLPGETGDVARLRYEDLQRERTGRVFSDVQTTTGIDPETVTKSLDDAIKAASEEISPAYEEMFAANAGVTSPRLDELAKDSVVAPYLRRATQAAGSLATTAGQTQSNARTWDLVKRALDRTISAQFKSGGAAPELISARDAVRGALDELIPEYKGLRDNADAPRMRAAREEGKGVLTGRNNTVEKIKQRAAQLTGRPLTAYQSGVIEGLIPTVEGWRNQLGSLTSAATEQKLAAAFGDGPARELIGRMKADLAIQQNAGRINPNIGSVTSQANMGGGAAPMLADAIRLARSPVESGLALLSRSGAYTRSQRDAMGQMLLEGATDANLARIFPQRGPPRSPRQPRGPAASPTPAPGPAPAAAGGPPAPTRRPPQRPTGGAGYKFERGAALKDTPQEYRDVVMNAPEGHSQTSWDAARKSTSWLPDPSQLQTRIGALEKKPFPSAEDIRLLRAMKEMKARLDGLNYEWPGTGRKPPEKAGMPGGAPEAIGASGGGAVGYLAAPDTNNDGVVDASERAAGAAGGAITGLVGAKAVSRIARGGPPPAKAEIKGPPAQLEAPKPPSQSSTQGGRPFSVVENKRAPEPKPRDYDDAVRLQEERAFVDKYQGKTPSAPRSIADAYMKDFGPDPEAAAKAIDELIEMRLSSPRGSTLSMRDIIAKELEPYRQAQALLRSGGLKLAPSPPGTGKGPPKSRR